MNTANESAESDMNIEVPNAISTNQAINGVASESDDYQVFVSYRSATDSQLAQALRKLIESSITIKPQVFVAGDGGLKPSNMGYKYQLQRAAKSARVFVAVITPSSVSREWIFFEAGAAWGRDLIYVPVLFGIAPDELPTTIGDYQAINADNEQGMLSLVSEIADAISTEVKKQFGTRYQAFKRACHLHASGTATIGPADESVTSDVYKMCEKGAFDEAADYLDSQLQAALDDNAKSHIEYLRIDSDIRLDETEKLERYRKLHAQYPSAAWPCYIIGIVDPVLSRQFEYLNKTIAIDDGNFSERAKVILAELKCSIGDTASCFSDLVKVMQTRKSNYAAELAAISSVQCIKRLSPIERLILIFAHMNQPSYRIYSSLVKIAEDGKFDFLRLFFAVKALSFSSTGNAHNDLGRARHSLELYSLAHKSYTSASELGLKVSVLNSASVVLLAGNAQAAMSISAQHIGPTDAADPSFPHNILTQIEAAIKNETDKEVSMLEQAGVLSNALWHFSYTACMVSSYNLQIANGFLSRTDLTIRIQNGEPEDCPDKYIVERLIIGFPGIFLLKHKSQVYSSSDTQFSFLFVRNGFASGFFCDNFKEAGSLSWYSWAVFTPDANGQLI